MKIKIRMLVAGVAVVARWAGADIATINPDTPTGQNDGIPHGTLCWRRGSFRTIRDGDWKLLFRKPHPIQIYNFKEVYGARLVPGHPLPSVIFEAVFF